MNAWSPLQPGAVFAGDYRVVEPLDEGGMGAVYVVDQLSTGKRRALKIMHPQLVADPKSRVRFADEARVGARIDSEHVVEVVAAGVDEPTGIPWLAMELLDGSDLEAVMRRRAVLPPAALAEIFSQLAHALSDAHAKGIVHSDLKPENIFLARTRRRGAEFIVKILDFGIARSAERSRTAATVTSAIGSPLWMAPEQATPGAKVRASTDVWALGLIAFYALTGRSYWRAASLEEFNLTALFAEVMALPLEPASARARELGAAELPAGFDAWFAACVHRDPLQRHGDAGKAITALTPLLTANRPAGGVAPTQPLDSAPGLFSSPGAASTAPASAHAAPAHGSSGTAAWAAPSSSPGAYGAPSSPSPFEGSSAYGSPPSYVAPIAAPMAARPAPTAPWLWIALGGGALAALAAIGLLLVVPAVFVARRSAAVQDRAQVLAAERAAMEDEAVNAARRAEQARQAAQEAEALRQAAETARAQAEHAQVPDEPATTSGVARVGSADVRGSLSREAIRRVVARHTGEVRHCYERGLASRPSLQGRVNMSFIISPSGSVQSATVASSTLNDPGVEACIVAAVRRWTFPAPDGGGVVAVNYPFILSPGAAPPDQPRSRRDDDPLAGLDGL